MTNLDSRRLDRVNPDLLDMDGKPMTLRAWVDLFEDLDAKTVAVDTVDREGETVTVRTVWDGVRKFPQDPLELFHTGIGTPDDMMTIRSYDTKSEALAGHKRIVDSLRGATEMVDDQ